VKNPATGVFTRRRATSYKNFLVLGTVQAQPVRVMRIDLPALARWIELHIDAVGRDTEAD